MAISSLLLSGLAQVTGQTYSSFNNREVLSGQVKMCEIFPSSIESKFEELVQVIKDLNEKAKSIPAHKKSTVPKISVTIPNDPTLEELNQFGSEITTKIETYQNDLSNTKKMKNDYETHIKDLLETLEDMNEITAFLLKYRHYDNNCITIDRKSIHNSLNTSLHNAEFLPPLVKSYVKGLLYLYPAKGSNDVRMQEASATSALKLDREVSKEFEEILEDLNLQEHDLEEAIRELENIEELVLNKEKELKDKTEAEAAEKKEKDTEKPLNKETSKDEESSSEDTPEDPSENDKKNSEETNEETEDQRKEESPSENKEKEGSDSPQKEVPEKEGSVTGVPEKKEKPKKDAPVKEGSEEKKKIKGEGAPTSAPDSEKDNKDITKKEHQKSDEESNNSDPNVTTD
ncbi:hypothetical protein VKA52_03580 [Halobacillus sp. HZG1]|uniref:hypothetical protein n=1 Tax=Halobacillus sp. HZG1 TaxID=3111769 RepID=UPI002DBA6402|nr:hypothetical protein [Halobacillus sp. HZG1]MEC3882807.1 hypothetical protein [Halobacillus sp. HZG1]